MSNLELSPGEPSSDLAVRYRTIRGFSERLAAPLSPEDACAQSMPDASPAKWHLAHTTWFFETFVLEPGCSGYRVFHPEFRVLFNSYYNSVGEQYCRPERGLLTRPSLPEVQAFRRHVDEQLVEWIEGEDVSAELAAVIEVGLHHEQQHQELLLTDLKHLFSRNPLHPAYRECPEPELAGPRALCWIGFEGGLHEIGDEGHGFAFDNERPRHRVHLEEFQLASRPVTQAEYHDFVQDGGYERPDLWLADGWAAVQEHAWQAPLYWENTEGDEIRAHTLAGLRVLAPAEPVTHVSLYEADAYARWAGARLPTEAEWEAAASPHPVKGNFQENERFHPAPAPAGGDPDALSQIFGDVWEWTSSAYAAYPGYRPPAGALGEYNGKFMCNQLVLRGGSCVTPNSHVRASYRNFFFPDARWQFSGIRLARDSG